MKHIYKFIFFITTLLFSEYSSASMKFLSLNNDSCFVADTLVVSPTCSPVPFHLSGYGIAGDDSTCNGDADDAKWFTFKATYPNLVIEVNPSDDIDVIIELYNGNNCNTLTSLKCVNTQGIGQLEKLVQYNLNMNQFYYFRVFDAATGTPLDSAFTVCVYHAPCPDVTITPSGPTVFCNGGSVVLTSSPGDSYTWNNTSTAQSITVSTSGNYFVTVIDFSSGCSTTSTTVSVTVNPLPPNFISIAGSTTFCQGDSVNISAISGASLTYQWRKNGVDIPGATNRVFTAFETGVYTARITNSNTTCTSTSNPVNVNVVVPPNTTYTHSNPTEICGTANINLSVAFQSGVSYQWYRNDSLLQGAMSNSFLASIEGIYYVNMTKTVCNVSSNPIPVSYFSFPEAIFPSGNSADFCEGTVTFVIADPIGGAVYNWFRNNDTIVGENQSFIETGQPGNYYFTVLDTNGCLSTSNNYVLTEVGNPVVELVADTTAACQGDTIVLNAVADRNVTYFWQRDFIPIELYDYDSIIVTSTGSYRFFAADSNSCTSMSNELFVTINSLPVIQLVASEFPVCSGDDVVLTLNGNNNYELTWFLDNGIIEGLDTTEYLVLDEGKYLVRAVDTNNCVGFSNAIDINFFSAPERPIIFSESNLSFCDGDSIQLVIGDFSEVNNYRWFFNDNLVQNNDQETFHALLEGSYFVELIDSNGCNGFSDTLQTIVFSNPEVSFNFLTEVICNTENAVILNGASPIGGEFSGLGVIGNMFNPAQFEVATTVTINYFFMDANGCSGSDSDTIFVDNCVNISEISNSNIQFIPNPSSTVLSIKTDNPSEIFDALSIFDINGRVVLRKNGNIDLNTSFNLSDLSPGTYFVQLTTKQKIFRGKFVKI